MASSPPLLLLLLLRLLHHHHLLLFLFFPAHEGTLAVPTHGGELGSPPSPPSPSSPEGGNSVGRGSPFTEPFLLSNEDREEEEVGGGGGGKTLQLIRPSKGHDKLELSEMVTQELAAIEEPISFVAVVGPYHGGKSFLLNVLLNSSHGFKVGSKPDPETKGIWMRVVPRRSLSGVDGSRVILLDTEGFYGEGATRLYDARIFALATLLSSHLIYNTLRTLGDAQSVSALADLAKQAQVFNLQNWIHTNEPIADYHSSPVDVDTSLLLKMLDFPPLTWVVQGFDIDLDSLHTPMEHLHRYLSAYAHSGDRTLDTLFTRGINCYTLRTPADLNLLRKQYGGQGLAADEELYHQLHPDYISDANKLRDAVFRNLKAKAEGKLTGKAVAALLPLLVHYANEDFPLQADRKLRDLLMDILVEGAFAGGVEYFHKYMKSLTKKNAVAVNKRQIESNGPIESAEAMSALASSALTTEEMEIFMTSAEEETINYCKHRCVGAPQDLVATVCKGQLGVKIDRMKPSYREENERQVREVLVRIGEGLKLTAEKRILELQLPMYDRDLRAECNQAAKGALESYEKLVGPHKGSYLYKEAASQIQEQIQLKCDKVEHINTEKISSIFNTAKNAFRSSYEQSFVSSGAGPDGSSGINAITIEESLQDAKARPISTKKLHEVHSASLKVAQLGFEKSVKDGGLTWMETGIEVYDFHHFQCLQWSKQRFKDIQSHHAVLIMDFCQKCVFDFTAEMKYEVSRIQPFPDNDETITDKVDEIAKHILLQYASMTKEYASAAVVEEKKKNLASNIDEIRAHHLKKNTALMAAFCYDPLMDAYRELKMQECERTFQNMWVSWSFWSRKCLWPGPRYLFGFKHSAYAVARKHLDKAQGMVRDSASDTSSKNELGKGIILSPATRNKVIQAWIEHDLAQHGNTVLLNFTILVVCVFTALFSLIWISKMLFNPWKQDAPSEQRWAGPSFNGNPMNQNKTFFSARYR